MPKRVIDFDALWGSDKLAACADWAQAEYAWLYGLADACGCFEITNLRVIWGRVAAIRRNLTIERLEQIFIEFQDKGLLFVWEHEGKRYAHWTGSDVPGRLPPPSWRMRLERFAPPVPKQQLAGYMARFARGRAALAGLGFRGIDAAELNGVAAPAGALAKSRWNDSVDLRARVRVEATQGQDLGFDLNQSRELEGEFGGNDLGTAEAREPRVPRSGRSKPAQAELWNSDSEEPCDPDRRRDPPSAASIAEVAVTNPNSATASHSATAASFDSESQRSSAPAPNFVRALDPRGMSARDLATQRELRVGQGPVCWPKGVRQEVLERDRLRQLVQAKSL